jgi:hypothetical protein
MKNESNTFYKCKVIFRTHSINVVLSIGLHRILQEVFSIWSHEEGWGGITGTEILKNSLPEIITTYPLWTLWIPLPVVAEV